MEVINDISFRGKIEEKEQWRLWIKKMPKLHFDPDWEVQIIPPCLGALIRFWITKGDKFVSVYFDGYSRLGFVSDNDGNAVPYFEIYDDTSGDIYRYLLDESEEMMAKIRQILNGEDKNNDC